MFSRIISKFTLNTQSHTHNNQNTKQLLGIITSIIPEFISIVISNLACWFIPQATSDTSITWSPHKYIASITSLPWPTIILISINLLTTATFIMLYYFEIRRDVWLIKHFDYSRRYHSMHLTRYKNEYPDIFSALGVYNRQYYNVYISVRVILLANIIASICIIITMDILTSGSVDYKTITSMITNFWLAYSKISRGIGIAQESLQGNLGIAYFNIQNLSFNRIDPQFKRHISNSNIGIGTTPPSRIASRRGSYQPSSSSNSGTPPDSLSNSLDGSFPNP